MSCKGLCDCASIQGHFLTKLCYMMGWNWKLDGKYVYYFIYEWSFTKDDPEVVRLEYFLTSGSLSHMNRMCRYSVRYIYFVLTTDLTFTLILQLPPSNFFLFLSPKVLSGLHRAGWVTPPAFVRFTLLPWHCRSRINAAGTNMCAHSVSHSLALSGHLLAVLCCFLLMLKGIKDVWRMIPPAYRSSIFPTS